MKRFVVVIFVSMLALQGCSQDTSGALKKLGSDSKDAINSIARDVDSKL